MICLYHPGSNEIIHGVGNMVLSIGLILKSYDAIIAESLAEAAKES